MSLIHIATKAPVFAPAEVMSAQVIAERGEKVGPGGLSQLFRWGKLKDRMNPTGGVP